MTNYCSIIFIRLLIIRHFSSIASGDLQLVWTDEFNGNSLNNHYWTSVSSNQNGDSNRHLQYYTNRPNNIAVVDGNLVITAQKENYDDVEGSANYTSGFITSQYKIDFTYGKIETRIKSASGMGLWPSFQLSPTYNVYGSWARSGQIIALNTKGSDPNVNYPGIYYGDYYPNNVFQGLTYTQIGLADDYHNYTIEWDSELIKFSIDDINYFNASKWYSKTHPYPAPFDQDFHIIFNLAVGGFFPGMPDDNTVFPTSFYVDYIRLYQQPSNEAATQIIVEKEGISGGLIAGLVVLIVFVIATIIVLRYFYLYTLRKRANSDSPPLELIGYNPETAYDSDRRRTVKYEKLESGTNITRNTEFSGPVSATKLKSNKLKPNQVRSKSRRPPGERGRSRTSSGAGGQSSSVGRPSRIRSQSTSSPSRQSVSVNAYFDNPIAPSTGRKSHINDTFADRIPSSARFSSYYDRGSRSARKSTASGSTSSKGRPPSDSDPLNADFA